MKQGLLSVIVIALCLFVPNPAAATIYVSEIIHEGPQGETAMLLSSFSDDGTAIKEVVVPGIMVRVSPDQQSIAYVGAPAAQTKTVAWDVFISDMRLTNAKALPFIVPPQRRGRSVVGMEWSPKGDKLLILLFVALRNDTDHTYPVDVILYDLTAGTFKVVTRLRAESNDAALSIHAGWFPDNRRIWTREIFQRDGGAVKIIDMETAIVQNIYAGMADVQPTRSGDALYLLSPQKTEDMHARSAQHTFQKATLKRYDVKTQKMSEVGVIPYAPLVFLGKTSLLGADANRLFVAKDYVRSLVQYELPDRKMIEKPSSDIMFIPKTASPRDKDVVSGFVVSGEQGFYGLMNYKTQRYQKIKDFSEKAPSGEGSWGGLLLNRIDWF